MKKPKREMVNRIRRYFFLTKGEDLSSPFVFLILSLILIDNSVAQLGIQNWIHPNSRILNENNSHSYLQFFDNSHIGLIGSDDSLTVYEHTYGINFLKLMDRSKIKVNFIQHISIMKLLKTDHSLILPQNYNEISLGYLINQGKYSADVEIGKNSLNNHISAAVFFGARIYSSIEFIIGKSIIRDPFELEFTYTDFEYILDETFTENKINSIQVNYLDTNYSAIIVYEESIIDIKSDKIPFTKIKIDKNINRSLKFNWFYLFKNNHSVTMNFCKQYTEFELELNNEANLFFFKMNNYTNDKYFFSFLYEYYFSKIKIGMTFSKQFSDFSLSDRIKPSRMKPDIIINDLFFDHLMFINNNDSGILDQEMISVRINYKAWLQFSPLLQLDWLQDQYNILLDTRPYWLGIPQADEENQILNINSKEAVNINIGGHFIINKWSFELLFSQHIPYKIGKNLESPQEEEGEINKIKYGGGLFQLSINRALD